MPTTFKDIYSRAIFRFADYDFLKQDIATREAALERHLMSAKAEFKRICKIDLESTCDLEKKEFTEGLDEDTIEILSLGIAFYWISYKTLNSELLQNVLNSRDYYHYSPAALLKEIQTLRKTLRGEFDGKMREYSYRNLDIGSLKA